MSKRAKSEMNHQKTVRPLKTEGDSRLLETFNHALSSLISHQNKSPSSHDTQVPEPNVAKKQRPAIWFPDEAVRRSADVNLDPHGETAAKRCELRRNIKEEDAFDEYEEWIDGSAKCRYPLSVREAQSHSSGWAMKYTNNHNKFVLKKTCVGVLLCSENCDLSDGSKVMIRPAISDKVRERQLGQPCPNSECRNGCIVHRKCTGNNGYPVTHFWVHHVDCIQFEAKGKHDHPRPEAKRSAMRKKETNPKYNYGVEKNMFYSGDFYASKDDCQGQRHIPLPTDPTDLAGHLNPHGDNIKSYSVIDGNEHACFATSRMRELARQSLGGKGGSTGFSRAYILCRTLPNYIPGFDLLESRIMSCVTPECPLVLVTIFRAGTVDGVLEHIKHLAVMCSPLDQKIRVPKWHFLVHDFPRDLENLVVETIVNLMVDCQMQTLLTEFQYKSVSSLYKMLRQRMLGTLRTFREHFNVCKYELLLRLQDPILVASCEEVFCQLQSECYTAKEFLNVDTLIKDGVLGPRVHEFWRFWGSDVISPAVFPAAKIVYAPIMKYYPYFPDGRSQTTARIRDMFVSIVNWLEKRAIIFSSADVWSHIYQKLQPNNQPDWMCQYPHSHPGFCGIPVMLSHGSCRGQQVSPYLSLPSVETHG